MIFLLSKQSSIHYKISPKELLENHTFCLRNANEKVEKTAYTKRVGK
jgi:hypothetical protein